MPVAWKKRIVATIPAPTATPAASCTCASVGQPDRCHASSATTIHSGWLASVIPNTRCVALSDSPACSRCRSSMRLPSGYNTADPSTQAKAIHAARSSRPSACPSCSSTTPTRTTAPTPSAAFGNLPRASRYSSGAHSMPATTVNWNVPATSHDGPLDAAKASSR